MPLENYAAMLETENPFNAAMRGFSFVESMADAARQNKLKEIELAQQQTAFAQKQAMMSDLASFSSLEKPTGAQYASLMVKYPALSDHFKKAYDVLSGEQKQSALNQSVQVYSALMSGRPDIAQNILQAQEEGYKNVGDAQSAQGMQQLRQLIATNPKEATFTAARSVAALSGSENMAKILEGTDRQIRDSEAAPLKTRQTQAEVIAAENKALASQYEPSKAAAEAKKAGYLAQAEAYTPQIKQSEAQLKGYEATNAPVKQQLENKLTEAQTKDYVSRIQDRANRWGLDNEKFLATLQENLSKNINPVLDKDARVLINKNRVDATINQAQSTRMLDIAAKLDASSDSGGVVTRGWEATKRFFGGQDAVTLLRQQAIALRNEQVVKALPPGNTTDRDIDIFMKGAPPDDADTKYMASYLRGQAKLSALVAKQKTLEADWVNEVGSLANPRRDIMVNGVSVEKGTSYNDFYKAQMGYNEKPTLPPAIKAKKYAMYGNFTGE